LQRTSDILSEVHYLMLPSLQAAWEGTNRRYVALEAGSGPTLDEALASGMAADDVISTVLQLAQALRRLHQAGWVLLGLTPAGIQMSQPVRITQFATGLRVGESLPDPLHVAGYSAPELVHRTQVTGKEDVYSLGAILYRGLSGVLIGEEGPDLSGLSDVVQTPGAPQLLASALAPVSERIDLEGFYRGLLALKRRLASKPIALRVASGTTIGLNPTRAANEDACGYVSWTTAHEGHAAYHAVLCAIDGMGGMEAGEVASTSALRAVLRTATTYIGEQMAGHGDTTDTSADVEATGEPDQRPAASLDPALLVQNAAQAAHAAAAGRQVGATITCAVVQDGRLTLGHVGDTRAYLLRDGCLVRLTRDHSLVAAMVASGMLTDDEARGHPESNKVLRSLGGLRHLPADYIDGLAVAYGQDMLTLQSEDQLLLCSDGVWGVISDDELQQILTDADDPEQAVATIIDTVLAGGAPDNAAVIIARCTAMLAA
jgi:protein phosphatase